MLTASFGKKPRPWTAAKVVLLTLAGLLSAFRIEAAPPRALAASTAAGLATRPSNTTCLAPQRPPQTTAVALQTVIRPGFTPNAIVQSPVQPATWYMVNGQGVINRYQRTGKSFALAGAFADARDRVLTTYNGKPYNELGLLGLAFHPRFADNGFVFLYYSAVGTQGSLVEARLSRFNSRDGGLTLDMNSEEVLLRVPRTHQYHWGGTLAFGSDGMLYAAFGDGAFPTKSPLLDNYFGKMVRINVDAAPDYRVPSDNPFVSVAGALPAIYARGFRNPWKWSFDRATDTLWLGDVGALAWEEINNVVKGGNYGWPTREGAHCANGTTTCAIAGLIDPVAEYPHVPNIQWAAAIGGYVYGGTSIPSLTGTYVFGDVSGRVFALRSDSNGKGISEVLLETGSTVNTFAQDEAGEIYVAAAGSVQLLVANGAPPVSTFPARLSQTGCMNPANPALPGPGLIPYDVNAALWSDAATKERWFAVPNGTTIRRMDDGDWDLPVGSVTVKAFRINGRLVETRLLMRHDDGEWAGYSYEWNDAQTDATLLPAGKVKSVGGQQWTYPSRSQCMGCHTEAAGRTLGLETAQLNRDLLYPSTGRMANQLATLNDIGMFSAPLSGTPEQQARLADPFNTTLPLEQRARAYLHANCALCHRPSGPGQGPEDFRYSLPSTSIGAVNVIPTQTDFGIGGARLIYPGKPDKSIISHRLQTLELGRMPPLGTRMVDTSGLALINQWIRSGLGMGSTDRDNDGFADNVDNCKSTSNPVQLDADGDGFGNICDADLNNDGFVNALDLGIFQKAFGTQVGQANFNPGADLNGDGRVNAIDLGLFKARFGKPVGDL